MELEWPLVSLEPFLFVGNAAARPERVRLFLALPSLFDALPLADLLRPDEPPLAMSSGCLDVELPAHGVCLLRPVDAHPSGYRFFK